MNKVTTKKLKLVEVPKNEQDDAVAFQLVEFSINYFGSKDTFILDTKILKDGTQVVIDGNGWIKDGYLVA